MEIRAWDSLFLSVFGHYNPLRKEGPKKTKSFLVAKKLKAPPAPEGMILTMHRKK